VSGNKRIEKSYKEGFSLLRAIRARPMHCLHPSLQTARVRRAADATDLLSTCLYSSFLFSFNKGKSRHRIINVTRKIQPNCEN